MVGIIGYGVYIPRYRIKTEKIAAVWGEDGAKLAKGLGVFEKSVPGPDEDVATISVEAARNAVKRAQIDPTDIGAIYVGSESHPYAVKPTGTMVSEAIGCSPHITCADFEFACKAGRMFSTHNLCRLRVRMQGWNSSNTSMYGAC